MIRKLQTRTKVLLMMGLIAAFSSTSFAATVGDDSKAAPAPKSNGQTVNGRGGGQEAGGGSCAPNAQEMTLTAEQTGLEDDEMKLTMTDRGPVIKIGETEIATNPGAYDDPNNQGASKQVPWCVKNKDFAAQLGAPEDGGKFKCNNGQKDDKPIKFKIQTKSGTLNAEIQVRKQNGKVVESRLILNSPGKDNRIELKAKYDKSGEDQVKGKFTMAAVPYKAAKADQEAGSLHLPIEGKLSKKPADPKDPSGRRFESCQIEGDGVGPKNKNETRASPKIDLVGKCIIYRGSTVPQLSERYDGCNTSQESTTSMSSMTGKAKGIGG